MIEKEIELNMENEVEIYNSFVLPDDVLQIIFQFLPSQELVKNLQLVNKHFCFLITKNSNFLWKIMVERDLVKILSRKKDQNKQIQNGGDSPENDQNHRKDEINDLDNLDWLAVYKKRFTKYYNWKYSLLVPQSNFDKLGHIPKKKKIPSSAEAFFKLKREKSNPSLVSGKTSQEMTPISPKNIKKRRKREIFKRFIEKIKSEYIFFLMYLKLIYFMFFVQTPQPKYAPAVEINIVKKRAVEGMNFLFICQLFILNFNNLILFLIAGTFK